MNTKGDWWGRPYVEQYQELSFPALLTDTHLTVDWFNPTAQKMEMPAVFAEALQQYFFLHNDSTFFEYFRDGRAIFLPSEQLQPQRLRFLITPVSSRAGWEGCVVTLTPDGFGDTPASTYELVLQRAQPCISRETHDPISSMLSALTMIAHRNQSEYGDPEMRERVNLIARYCYQMLRSNNNVCTYLKHVNGTWAVSPKTLDLCLFLDQLCRLVSTMIEGEGIRCRYTIPDEPVLTSFDPDLLATILFHLVSNAAKYLGEQGRITIHLQLTQDAALLSVADNGLGIPAESLGAVFEPFYSIDPRTGGPCGGGLGLTISQLAAKKLGGTLLLHSTEGEGTHAVLSLPLRQGESNSFSLYDVTGTYLYDRYSALYVGLSDVCNVCKNFGAGEAFPL